MSSTPLSAGDRSDLLIVLRECLANGQTKCWEEFIRLAQPVLASAAVRSLNRWNANATLADDLIQESFAKLFDKNCHVLRAYRGNESNSLRKYLHIIASHVVADYLKGDKLWTVPEDSPEAIQTGYEDPLYQKVERELLLQRVKRCLSKQKPRNQTIFWLYHRHGFRPQAIARYPGINLGQDGVEAVITRLTKLVRDCVKRGGDAG